MITEYVPVADGITIIFILIAFLFLIKFRGDPIKASSKIILLVILCLEIFFSFSNLLEWTGISSQLDQFEDVIQVVEPLFWGFLFYSFIQGFKQQELLDSQIQLRDEKNVTELLLDLMTHDLINYNTVALGNMELLSQFVAQDVKLSDLVTASMRSIKANSLLIENVKILHQMLEMKESFQIAPVRLIAVIESAKEKTQAIYPEYQLTIAFSPNNQELLVEGHAILENVFINLLTNSVRYRKPDQNVISIDIEIRQEGSFTFITYSDKGIGIPDDLKERIFDRFAVAPHERKGTGLGLSISKRIVESLGGDIQVVNRRDTPDDSSTGVAFILRLASG